MNYSRFNHYGNKRRKKGEFRSGLERKVNEFLLQQELAFFYESERFPYYLKRQYTPDFQVKGEKFDFWIEVKGRWDSVDRNKFLAVITNNPDLHIFVALQAPRQTISKQSKTMYCQWAQKYGIAWCPCPIPQQFFDSWVNGVKLTYPAPTKAGVDLQMVMPLTTKEMATVSSVTNILREK